MGDVITNFKQLQVDSSLVNNLLTNNIVTPTAIQEQIIPLILAGKDVVGQSPTGSGKTLAYLLPILTTIDIESKNVQALILAPTRELAMQITKLIQSLGSEHGIVALPILGEANTNRQLASLKKKPQVIVATPGRILDLIKMRKINSQTIKTIVIDEADKMWQMGFKQEVSDVVKTTLKDRQVILVSATITKELLDTSEELLSNPTLVNVNPKSPIPDTIKHHFIMSEESNKGLNLQKLINIYKPKKAIIFINSNEGITPFVKRFHSFGFEAVGLHSDLKQHERKDVLEKFKMGKAQLLVTTDLFARGMDVKEVDIVFNFDLPLDDKHYIHRVGRTGRAGHSGLVINFVTNAQKFIMSKYEKKLKVAIQEYGIGADKVFPVNLSKKNKS